MNDVEHILRRVSSGLQPTEAVKKRSFGRLHGHMYQFSALEDSLIRQQKIATTTAKQSVWEQVLTSTKTNAESLLEDLPAYLPVSIRSKQAIWFSVQNRLLPTVESFFAIGRFKWLAAVTAVAIIATMSPSLVVAPPTFADAQVILSVTNGEVSLSQQNLWVPITEDLLVKPGMTIRTEVGTATISVRDDAVLRLAPFTTVTIRDTQEYLDVAPEAVPAFFVHSGQTWLLGMVPSGLRGVTLATPHGQIAVNEGSFSVKVESDFTEVSTWDRHVQVSSFEQKNTVFSGKRLVLSSSMNDKIVTIPFEEFSQSWAREHLSRDAVHRQYIAHLQHERLSALAGTLPTSSFYPVKRFAERVDVLLSFSQESKVQKQLSQAQLRLSEAAALLQGTTVDEGQVEDSLNEYTTALNSILEESDSSTLSQLLLQQNIVESKADLAAAKPGDSAYKIKQTIFLASAEFPTINNQLPDLTLLTEALDTIASDIEAGNFETVQANWSELSDSIAALEVNGTEFNEQQIEALTVLEKIALQVKNEPLFPEEIDTDTVAQIVSFAPPEPEPAIIKVKNLLTIEEVDFITTGMYERIYIYSTNRGRQNQLIVEIKSIENSPDKGRLLRSLYRKLPAGSNLTNQIRKEIVTLKLETQ